MLTNYRTVHVWLPERIERVDTAQFSSIERWQFVEAPVRYWRKKVRAVDGEGRWQQLPAW
jgi:hypothetical protein